MSVVSLILEEVLVFCMQVELVIDGKKLPINGFVQRMIGNSMEGMIEALHGVDEDWDGVEIKIVRDE
ncbi:hypothetical protein AMET1_1241 [Methanonatronarchaeum thermophilum]|uniref:Uncharacterized protein n=2 Tax=Methanonatronarchaeum thermophilum TaxID=1927129 RepID=A0A1Y3GA88_9EURY|nr:hypothetical protein AMET1_1241 [Methanonatronarchaeum thermophilum]